MQGETTLADTAATHTEFKHVYIDASHALKSKRNTGVQRVVRSLCRCLPLVESGPPTSVVTLRGQNFSVVPGQVNSRGEKEQHVSLLRSSWRMLDRLHRKIQRRAPVGFESGDLLLLPDAYWIKPEVWQAADRARQQGAFVVSIVYDLIPMTHPQFVAVKGQHAFEAYVEKLATHSDMMLAISQTVRDELMNYLPRLFASGNFCRDVKYFRLGAQFSLHTGPVREIIRQLFPKDGKLNPFLMVATFDPRKNHDYLLDAFDQIWQSEPTRKLCLLGSPGGGSEQLLDRIAKHPRLGKQLFVIHDASDAEVDYCYRHARAVIMPSIVEGFGLPIVEALWHGCQVFASETPTHREVGGDDCSYFDLNSPASLCRILLDWESLHSGTIPRRAASTRCLDWLQSSAMLLDRCWESYAASAQNHDVDPIGLIKSAA